MPSIIWAVTRDIVFRVTAIIHPCLFLFCHFFPLCNELEYLWKFGKTSEMSETDNVLIWSELSSRRGKHHLATKCYEFSLEHTWYVNCNTCERVIEEQCKLMQLWKEKELIMHTAEGLEIRNCSSILVEIVDGQGRQIFCLEFFLASVKQWYKTEEGCCIFCLRVRCINDGIIHTQVYEIVKNSI